MCNSRASTSSATPNMGNEKAAHTPGPLCVSSSFLVCQQETGCVVARCDPMGITVIDVPVRECIANAKLFSAAPDLLAALRELIADRDAHGWPDFPASERARAAIAKATGAA